jgi:hypothetical protein
MPYQTTTQDDKGEDEVEDDIPELIKTKAISLPLSSKCKGRKDRSAMYSEGSGPMSNFKLFKYAV